MGGPADDKPLGRQDSRPPPSGRGGTAPRAPAVAAAREGGTNTPKGGISRPPGPKGLIGQVISGRYKVERLLGEGGMGAVYQVEHMHMRKRMAIKVLHQEMIRLPEVVARFEREAMAAAHIDHPNVVTATDFGKLEDGSFFLALEFVEGKSLREVIAQGPLELGRALHIGRQIASALQRAHLLKIVHRDLKPENVMLVERDSDPDFVKVLDFGIAKVSIGELTSSELSQPGGPGQPILTQAGMVYGTPEYMAPEQALGQPVDARADLYALGIIMYEMLVGVRPFEADSKVALLGMQVTAPVPPMIQKAPGSNVPAEVEALIVRLLAKEATERLGDERELIEGITNILSMLAATGRVDQRFAPPPASRMSGAAIISGIGPLPPELQTTANPPSTRPPGLSLSQLLAGKGWLVALVAGVFGFIVLAIAIIVVLKGRETPKTGGDAEAVVDEAGAPVTSAEPPASDKVKEGIASIERGDYGSGIGKLESLADEGRAREDVQRALLTGYMKTNKPKEAMREAGLILDNASMNLEDKKQESLRIAIRDVAIREGEATTKSAVDEAFVRMKSKMKARGWDDLYDIAYNLPGYPKAADRAKSELARGDRAKMSAALAVTIDLERASNPPTCAAKNLFERAAAEGDGRTILVLNRLAQAHQMVRGGGFRRQGTDLLGCLHDGSIQKAVAAIEDRMKRGKRP